MEISVKSEYALRAVFDLACREGPQPTKIAEIAARQGIPQKFLELILSQLKQGDFWARGAGRGRLFLARPAETITVGEILRHIDGPISPARKQLRESLPADSPFPELWGEVEEALSGVLDRTTFDDLVARWRENSTRQVANWQI